MANVPDHEFTVFCLLPSLHLGIASVRQKHVSLGGCQVEPLIDTIHRLGSYSIKSFLFLTFYLVWRRPYSEVALSAVDLVA